MFAAWNMLGKIVPYETVPFFWTRFFGEGLIFCGSITGKENFVMQGDNNNFIGFYIDGNKLNAAIARGNKKLQLVAIN